jgi:hypothetical protein
LATARDGPPRGPCLVDERTAPVLPTRSGASSRRAASDAAPSFSRSCRPVVCRRGLCDGGDPSWCSSRERASRSCSRPFLVRRFSGLASYAEYVKAIPSKAQASKQRASVRTLDPSASLDAEAVAVDVRNVDPTVGTFAHDAKLNERAQNLLAICIMLVRRLGWCA